MSASYTRVSCLQTVEQIVEMSVKWHKPLKPATVICHRISKGNQPKRPFLTMPNVSLPNHSVARWTLERMYVPTGTERVHRTVGCEFWWNDKIGRRGVACDAANRPTNDRSTSRLEL